ncbi:larval cuticle protein 1-like [Spodoptera litura]|uniref:Cuticular protein RR-1 n=1 Tax=Spodoptera litura TaxID=69820 RepID=A0A4U7BHQ9_SPOLT|nr:larval cuticle protein 1-like [Spodoptera litura]TKX27767.1 cuticular protein RR-1 [Spodoptera litura]
MKSMIFVALALVAVAAAFPVDEPIKILRSNFDKDPNGDFQFGFETENGIKRDEQGKVKEVLDEENKPHSVVVVRGSYSYTNADGTVETIDFIADENGFQAQGPSIPKNPPARR